MPALVLAAWLVAAANAQSPIPNESRQLIVVVTADWSATSGELSRFNRDAGQAWRRVGAPVRVVVGRSGLGWGLGLHPAGMRGPTKREGDGRAPAGVFTLSAAFGYSRRDSIETGLPYLQANSDLECVDDVASGFYNEIVDRASVTPDWSSHEEMRRRDDLYSRGVVVDHNSDPVRPGGGSCIFLHVWRGAGSTTSGCTAMERAELVDVLAWLDRAAGPVLVQLPVVAYGRLARPWQLPELPRR